MSRLIETLESRTLLSTTSPALMAVLDDAATLKADNKTLQADVKLCFSDASTALKTLTADVRTSKSVNGKAELATLRDAEKACGKTLKADLSALSRGVGADVKKIVADDRVLDRKPGNATALAHRSADLAKLSTDISAITIAGDTAECQTRLDGDLAAVGTANSTAQADVGSAQGLINACATKVQGDTTTLLSALSTFAAAAPLV